MNKMLLEFSNLLVDRDYDPLERRWGPVFNRWLPDEDNALEIECDGSTRMKMWFDGIRKFSRGVEVPQTPEMNLHKPDLDGGKLFGRIELDNVSDDEMQAVIRNQVGSDEYVRLGKRVVTKLVYHFADKLRNILTITYGQYWIGPFPKWDSRECSLGYYCNTLVSMKWSIDGGETWNKFIPNASTVNISADIVHTMGSEHQYIKKNDWTDIESFLKKDYFPTLGASMLNQAHKRRDQGEYKFALIEAVTALEIAIRERLEKNIQEQNFIKEYKDDQKLTKQIDGFFNLSMPAKLIVVSSLVGNISTEEIRGAILAIRLRNKIAHEAAEVADDDNAKIELIDTLIKTISKILITPPLKFPKINFDN